MSRLFHFAPEPFPIGSCIPIGNFGRIIIERGQQHHLHQREMTYEAVRKSYFAHRPSRLECLFCFPTLQEARLCHAHIKGYENSILHEVETEEADLFIADMNNGIQHFAVPAFNIKVINYYWSGWTQPQDPQAIILREVLLRNPAKVLRHIVV